MTPLCSAEEQCLHFFPGMGFRPAVHEVQRNQYGDRMTLVVGDDSPVQGKIPPGTSNFALPVDVYAPLLGRDGGVLTAALGGPGAGPSGAVPFGAVPVPIWTGGGGSSGGSPVPPIVTDTKADGPETPPEPPVTPPGTPETPPGTTPPGTTPPGTTPPGTTPPGTLPDTPTTEVPDTPELPPLLPVSLPDAAPLLIAALLGFAVLRRRTA